MFISLLLTVHHFSLWWHALALVLIAVFLKASVVDLQPLQALLNAAIRECLVLSQITDKEAASLCGMSYQNFNRALSGEAYRSLSLAHLFQLPWRFWLRFGPMLMWMVAKKHAEEIAETFSIKRSA